MSARDFVKDRWEVVSLLIVFIGTVMGGCYHLDTKIDRLNTRVDTLSKYVYEMKGKVDLIANKLLSTDIDSISTKDLSSVK